MLGKDNSPKNLCGAGQKAQHKLQTENFIKSGFA